MLSSRSISVGRGPMRDQPLVKPPHGLGHRRVVAVDQQPRAERRIGAVAGEVDLATSSPGTASM
jgi:hypothetical protein